MNLWMSFASDRMAGRISKRSCGAGFDVNVDEPSHDAGASDGSVFLTTDLEADARNMLQICTLMDL